MGGGSMAEEVGSNPAIFSGRCKSYWTSSRCRKTRERCGPREVSKAQNELCARATGWRKTVKLRCVAWRRFQSIRLDCEKCLCSAAVSTLFKLASQFSTVRSGPGGIDKYKKGDRAAAIEFGKVGAFMMFVLAWFSGCAIGLVIYALKPRAPMWSCWCKPCFSAWIWLHRVRCLSPIVCQDRFW